MSSDRIKFYLLLTPEEKQKIQNNMAMFGVTNMSHYIRTMAIRGRMVKIDLSELQEVVRLQRICANNLNQYAKKANQTGSIYAADIEDLRKRQDEIWELLSLLYKRFSELN